MKRIIYTAVALIFCASVFGIADYYNAKKQGTLVNYTDEEQPTEAIVPEKKTEITTPAKDDLLIADTKKEIKKEPAEKKKNTRKKIKDTYQTAVIPNEVISETPTEPVEKLEPIDVVLQSKTTDPGDDSTIQPSSERKISMKMFSRAPIREKKLKKK